jgi:hypothetical protein
MKTIISFYIGKLSKRYRLWYHRTHNNEYLWGISRFMKDSPMQGVPSDDFDFIKNNITIS